MNRLELIASEIAVNLSAASFAMQEWSLALKDAMRSRELPYIDRTDEMPINLMPFHADFVRNFPGRNMWPLRSLADITGITIHHTLSHSPLATANYCTRGKGYPTTQYHYWVSSGDACPRYLLVDPALAMWHDHTGAHPTTLSVGMAGSLHIAKPPREQIEAAATLVAWLMDEYDVPISQVQGHCDRYAGTVCPGWYEADWRDEFFDVLRAVEL